MKFFFDGQRGTIITYRLIRRNIPQGESYGVEAEMRENDRVTCRSSVDDVFCFREEAEGFISLLAENGVEPCHLAEIIYDRLSV